MQKQSPQAHNSQLCDANRPPSPATGGHPSFKWVFACDCRAAMKAASPSALTQVGTTPQPPTRLGSAATSSQQPSPHTSSPVHALSRAATNSPTAVALHSHPDHCTPASHTVGAAATHNSHRHGTEHYEAQAQRGATFMSPSVQQDQSRTADGMHGCSQALGAVYGAEGEGSDAGTGMCVAEGSVHGAGGAMPDAEGSMCDSGGAMHNDLWTQEGSVVEYPAGYRQQVRLHCDQHLCLAFHQGCRVSFTYEQSCRHPCHLLPMLRCYTHPGALHCRRDYQTSCGTPRQVPHTSHPTAVCLSMC